jgi:acyl-CoA synthetase (AMP-forming)/AMP-acid ligase II
MAATVFDRFEARARQRPQADFLCVEAITARAYGIDAGSHRYGELLQRIEGLRQRYAAAGYGHGHRAGLLLENRPDFFLHWFALNALGVSVVPINNDLRAAELRFVLAHSELCLAISLPQRIDDLRAAADPRCVPVLLPVSHGGAVPDAPSPAPKAGQPLSRDSECALLYTSGTTGRPKGCVLSNDYFLRAGAWYAGIGGLCALHEGRERLITQLPLTHMNAMAYSAMAMVMTGGCLVQLDRFHPGSWWDSVRASGATVAHYLGVMPAMLLGALPCADDRRHAVRFGFGAGVDRRQQEGDRLGRVFQVGIDDARKRLAGCPEARDDRGVLAPVAVVSNGAGGEPGCDAGRLVR